MSKTAPKVYRHKSMLMIKHLLKRSRSTLTILEALNLKNLALPTCDIRTEDL